MPVAAARAARLLRPGGLLFFRDYGSGDLAQQRLEDKGQTDGEGTYERGEGTLARYFSLSEAEAVFADAGFDTRELKFVERDITNRKRAITMNRKWVQAKFVKRGAPPVFDDATSATRPSDVTEAEPARRRQAATTPACCALGCSPS